MGNWGYFACGVGVTVLVEILAVLIFGAVLNRATTGHW